MSNLATNSKNIYDEFAHTFLKQEKKKLKIHKILNYL